MVAQKTQRHHSEEITNIKEVLAELQIFVQKHQVSIGSEMTSELQLKTTIEALRNELDIRFDLALRDFYDKISLKMESLVSIEKMQEMLFEKLHKREFEIHYERLETLCTEMENKLRSQLPAMD